MAFLLHGLLDYVVDTHFDAVQRSTTAIDGLEDQLFDDSPRDAQMQRRTFELRKSLVDAAPAGAADAGGRQHPDAPRPRRSWTTR